MNALKRNGHWFLRLIRGKMLWFQAKLFGNNNRWDISVITVGETGSLENVLAKQKRVNTTMQHNYPTFLCSKWRIPEAICNTIISNWQSLRPKCTFSYFFPSPLINSTLLDVRKFFRLPPEISSVTTRILSEKHMIHKSYGMQDQCKDRLSLRFNSFFIDTNLYELEAPPDT